MVLVKPKDEGPGMVSVALLTRVMNEYCDEGGQSQRPSARRSCAVPSRSPGYSQGRPRVVADSG